MKKTIIALLCTLTLFGGDIVVKPSHNSVDATIGKLGKIVRAKGFTVFAVIDHAAGAQAVGMRMPASKEIVFGNPKLGTKLMLANPLAGLDLPIRVLVFTDKENTVKIAYRNGTWLMREYGLQLPKLEAKMNGALDKITTEAAQP